MKLFAPLGERARNGARLLKVTTDPVYRFVLVTANGSCTDATPVATTCNVTVFVTAVPSYRSRTT